MRNLHRVGMLSLSLIVLAGLAGVIGNAAVTIVTPNSAVVNYTLAAGATSSPITPAANQPVIVIGANTTSTNFAASTVTLVHIPSTMIRWIGMEAPTGAVTRGGSTTVGTHIIWLDNSAKVGLQILSADQFVIHNGATASQTGNVKLIW